MSVPLLRVASVCCLSALCLGFAGCYARYPFGDVTYSIPKVVLGMGVPTMHFPPVDIRHPGRKVIRVRDLNYPSYPKYFVLKVRRNENVEGATGQPWRTLKFAVSFRTVDGRIVYSQEYDLSKLVATGSPFDDEIWLLIGSRGSNRVPLPIPAPALHDYDMVIDVISPSSRKSDRLEILAFFDRQGPEEILKERKRKVSSGVKSAD